MIDLREECNSKNQLINLILENVFKNGIPWVTSYTNSSTLLTPKDNYQFHKRFNKNHHHKRFSKNHHHKSSCNTTLVKIDFMLFLLMRTIRITMKIYAPQSHHVKDYILTTIKIKIIQPEKLTEINLIIGHSSRKNSQLP